MKIRTAADYVFCAECEHLRLKPPAGLFGTNDVACDACGKGYAVLDTPVTADALAYELDRERQISRELRAQLMERPWILVDAEARALENPGTFGLPPSADRYGLRPGDQAKLIFSAPRVAGYAERMWVEVVSVNGVGDYEGKLRSRAVSPFLPAKGTVGKFGAEHVIAVALAPPEGL